MATRRVPSASRTALLRSDRARQAQHALDEEPAWPVQYGYAVKRKSK